MSRASDTAGGAVPNDVDLEALARADLALSETIEALERVEWRHVPTISTAEAAAFTSRLIEARDATQAAVEGTEANR